MEPEPSAARRRTPVANGGNLPAELTSFVGRRRELSELKQLLASSRLVTLTGIGGVGKSRLAQRVGAELSRAFPDGVWFVELAELHDPELLAETVAAALRQQNQSMRPPSDVLSDHVAGRQLLLVLDNCEHLLPACAVLVEGLLRARPQLRILCTSREPLGVMGEVIFQITPLPTPDPTRRLALRTLGRCASVALFVARARDAVPGFDLTEDNREAVVAICRRLDGLPLAIELAAARLRTLAPQQIMERLADRFTLLSRGSRQAPDRQQTLRASMDWSFELCTSQERKLWARLAVFAGSFQLDAVEGVCASDDLSAPDLLNLIASLIDKSILICEQDRPRAWYRLLETLRAYGEEKLRAAGEEPLYRRRHRDWYLRLVERAQAEWISDRQEYWLTRMDLERPNLRTAVECCLTDIGGGDAALRIAVSLPWRYWWAQGLFGEGRRWLDRALAHTARPTALRAKGLLLASQLAIAQGDVGTGNRLLDQGAELAQRLNAPAEVTYAAYIRGLAALFQNDLPVALESFDRALRILPTGPEMDLNQQLDLLHGLGVAAGLASDEERAAAYLKEMLEITEPLGEKFHRSNAMWSLGLLAWLRGDLHEAATQEWGSLQLKQTRGLNDRLGNALCLEVLAWIAASQRRARRAATLLGAADSLWTELDTSIASFRHLASFHDACEEQVRAALGEMKFRAAVQYGRDITPEDTLAYAREEERRPPPVAGTGTPLTRREHEVADLIARGLSNKDIATTLVISRRTAESHVEHILAKLDFASRAQVAAWVAEQRAQAEK